MYFKIKTYIYPFKIIVFMDETDIFVWNKLKNNNSKEGCNPLMNFSEQTSGRTHLLPSLDLVIRLESYPDKYTMLGVIYHEVMHASLFAMDRIGCEYIAGGSNEPYTYFGEYLFVEICKKINI